MDEAFALMDLQASAESRAARREAAKVLAAHGLSGQVTLDVEAFQTASSAPSGGRPGGASRSARARAAMALARRPKPSLSDAHPLSADESGWVPVTGLNPDSRAARIREIVG